VWNFAVWHFRKKSLSRYVEDEKEDWAVRAAKTKKYKCVLNLWIGVTQYLMTVDLKSDLNWHLTWNQLLVNHCQHSINELLSNWMRLLVQRFINRSNNNTLKNQYRCLLVYNKQVLIKIVFRSKKVSVHLAALRLSGKCLSFQTKIERIWLIFKKSLQITFCIMSEYLTHDILLQRISTRKLFG